MWVSLRELCSRWVEIPLSTYMLVLCLRRVVDRQVGLIAMIMTVGEGRPTHYLIVVIGLRYLPISVKWRLVMVFGKVG